jgi:hypothetical protein
MERICEGVVLCKVKAFEVWILVELGGRLGNTLTINNALYLFFLKM